MMINESPFSSETPKHIGICAAHKINFFQLLILLIIFSSFLNAQNNNCNFEQALEIANRKAIELGRNIDSMRIEVYPDTLSWDNLIRKDISFHQKSFSDEVKSKLKQHTFWWIYYRLKSLVPGGDFTIFIDYKSCEILYYYLGE